MGMRDSSNLPSIPWTERERAEFKRRLAALEAGGGGGGGGATDLAYNATTRLLTSSTGIDVTLPLVDTSNPGLMSASDKSKLDGVAAGANNYVHPNHSGDVTSVGDGATTIAADAVTNAKLANMATATIKGRSTAGTGDPEDLTGTQATALLDTFTSGAKGLVPASGGDPTKFLRADGSWAAPGGGGAANFDGYTQMAPAATLFVANSANATALGTQAQVANRTIIAPFVPAYTMAIDQLGVSVSTLLAGANAKCVVFDSDSNGRPTTILRETGGISAAAAATVFAAITSLTLTAGKTYWIGVRASGTFTLRTLALGALPALDYTNAATPAARQCLIRTETFANAAGNWTYASSQHSNALMPLVLMRVA